MLIACAASAAATLPTERIFWMINLFERLSTERRHQNMVRQTMHYGPG